MVVSWEMKQPVISVTHTGIRQYLVEILVTSLFIQITPNQLYMLIVPQW